MADKRPPGQHMFEFVHASWENYVLRLKGKFRDDHHGLMDLKAAYWAGARSYQAGIKAIYEQKHLTPQQRRDLVAKLDEGLQGFAEIINSQRTSH